MEKSASYSSALVFAELVKEKLIAALDIGYDAAKNV